MMAAWSNAAIASSKTGSPIPREMLRYFYSQYDGINLDKAIQQAGQPPMAAPGVGMNPEQAVPPQVAAQMMAQKKNG
jgi:hypothetical protein